MILVARPRDGVSAACRLAELVGPPFGRALEAGTVSVVRGDVRCRRFGQDEATWRALARRIDGVVHLAARTDFGGDDAVAFRPDNVRAAGHAARLAALAGVPLHHVSTAYVSGTHGGCFRERDFDLGQEFHNAYERTKWEAEAAVTHIARRAGTPLAILRLGLVLPEEPVPGVSVGPGPLAYLRPLVGLEGRTGGGVRVVRSPGMPAGLLNAVPLGFAVEAIRRSIAREMTGVAVYHVTARRSLAMAEVVRAINAALVGVEGQIVPPDELVDPDPFERLLDRRMRAYRPYRSLTTTYDRAALEGVLGLEDDGASPTWLARVLARHAFVWRTQPGATVRPGPVAGYFGEFLAARIGRPLLPGLATLDATFTVSVRGGGRYRIQIARGVLVAVGEGEAPTSGWDYETDGDSFLAAVQGRRRAAELFFDQKIQIRGDLKGALSTALVLEEFFATHPYAATASFPRA